jgi:hypothetical protein
MSRVLPTVSPSPVNQRVLPAHAQRSEVTCVVNQVVLAVIIQCVTLARGHKRLHFQAEIIAASYGPLEKHQQHRLYHSPDVEL